LLNNVGGLTHGPNSGAEVELEKIDGFADRRPGICCSGFRTQ
jgi:hypothetical protein